MRWIYRNLRSTCAILLTGLVGGPSLCGAQESNPVVLFDFGKNFDVSRATTQDAAASIRRTNAAAVLRVETGTTENWPGVTLKAPEGKWDLSTRACLSVTVGNAGSDEVLIYCRADNPGADGLRNCETESVTLKPGQSGTIEIPLLRKLRGLEETNFIGMRGNPPVSTNLDPSNVTQLIIFVDRPTKPHVFEVHSVRASGSAEPPMDAQDFFPMIDEFGQYIHKDWPGKTHSLEELVAHGKEEERDLAAHPGPPDRDEYGGWSAGPQLEATGFFRVQQYEGKWWLIDPKGRLFWSHGIDCVRSSNPTPATDRERYFRNLPQADSPFMQFYGSGARAPHGYYVDHSPYRTYDFSRANLLRKYGQDREEAFAEITHRRLKSWGLNTIANWSDSSIYLMRRTPYVCTINSRVKTIEGTKGYWGKFPDVFDPSFSQGLRRRLAMEKGRGIGDPWCIGFFVDNELSWGDEVSLAIGTLVSPSDQPAKKVFISDLKTRYKTISDLNAVWGTDHSSWDVLLECQQAPDQKRAWVDLTTFYTRIAETYFMTIRDALKEAAPNQLYLGCRFAWVNDRAARAGAKFCDVVSYNRYSYSVAEQHLPDDINRPIIIGEFHFGALDRGMFHTGLKKATDQKHRARLYEDYVRGAMRNPYIIGTHWFQYKDQPTTGRGDGENYQIGFIDICDTPYPEIVEASRSVGRDLYAYRLTGE
jgi:hypothetical protein